MFFIRGMKLTPVNLELVLGVEKSYMRPRTHGGEVISKERYDINFYGNGSFKIIWEFTSEQERNSVYDNVIKAIETRNDRHAYIKSK